MQLSLCSIVDSCLQHGWKFILWNIQIICYYYLSIILCHSTISLLVLGNIIEISIHDISKYGCLIHTHTTHTLHTQQHTHTVTHYTHTHTTHYTQKQHIHTLHTKTTHTLPVFCPVSSISSQLLISYNPN